MESKGKGEDSSDDGKKEVVKEKKNKNTNKKRNKKEGKGEAKERTADPVEDVLTYAEIGRMIDLGLGRGIDATNPSPWLNKSAFQVREVTPHNIIGTEEGGVWQSYSHEVTSVQSLQTNMSASVPLSQQVSVGIDAELSRSYSTNRRSVGKKITTRSISYRADFEDLKKHRTSVGGDPALLRQNSIGNKQDSIEAASPHHRIARSKSLVGRMGHSLSLAIDEESVVPTFEERLSQWILERLFEEEVEGVKEIGTDDDPTEALATFLAKGVVAEGHDKVEKKIMQKCKEFIDHFCITHYVSCVQLGASKYQVMSEEDYQTQIGVKGSLGIEQMASVAVEEKASFIRRNRSSETTMIGYFENKMVKRGTTDEAVVGVKFQPISALVKMRVLKNKLQKAIRNYIENQEHSKAGPFIITCNDEQVFLKVTQDFKVVATANIKESSDFFISSNEDGDNPYEFSIMYMAPSKLKLKGIKPIPRYLYASVNTFGRNHGPLELKFDAKDTKTKMNLLSRRVRHFNPVDTQDWVNSRDIFYINCKQRAVKRNSFICVKRTPQGMDVKEEYVTCCVPTIKKHDEDKEHYMLFRLIRAGKKKEKGENENEVEKEEELMEKEMSSRDVPSVSEKPPHVGEDTVDISPKKQKKNKGGGGGGGAKKEGKGDREKKKKKKESLSEIAEEGIKEEEEEKEESEATAVSKELEAEDA